MTCSVCNKEAERQRSVIKFGKIIKGCEQCLPAQLVQGDSAKYYRETQKRDFRRELTQEWQPEYAKAYPELAREAWGDDVARKYA